MLFNLLVTIHQCSHFMDARVFSLFLSLEPHPFLNMRTINQEDASGFAKYGDHTDA